MTDAVMRCRCGERCRDGENLHDEHGERVGRLGALLPVQATREQGAVCDGCARATATALRSLAVDYADLSELLQPSNQHRLRDPELAGPPGKPEPTLPLRVDVLDLQLLIDYEVDAWAESVADHDEVDWSSFAARHSRPLDRIHRACELLGYRLTTLLTLGPTEHRARSLGTRRADGHDPDTTTRGADDYWATREGWEAGLLLRRLHERAERYCGRDRADRIPTPCPACHRRGLVREHRANLVRCRECDARLNDDDYDALRNAALRAYGLPEVDAAGVAACPRCRRVGSQWEDRHGRQHCQLCGPGPEPAEEAA
uniref:hypothetical protein n=1 Tax=Pseudonocardia sp. CA-138482 TaxID=3240023 RepID=UPI003F498D16